MASYSRCLRDIGKGAVVVVVEELAGQALVGFWMTVELLFGGTAARLGGSVPDDVIRAEQVQPTIVVVIEPAGRYRPHAPKLGIDSGDACPGGDVGEAAGQASPESIPSLGACGRYRPAGLPGR